VPGGLTGQFHNNHYSEPTDFVNQKARFAQVIRAIWGKEAGKPGSQGRTDSIPFGME
jgi:hypothetical protein